MSETGEGIIADIPFPCARFTRAASPKHSASASDGGLDTRYETGTRTVSGLRRLRTDRAADGQPDFLPFGDEHRARSANRGPDGGTLSAARDAADDGAGAGADRALLDVVFLVGLSLACDARRLESGGSRHVP